MILVCAYNCPVSVRAEPSSAASEALSVEMAAGADGTATPARRLVALLQHRVRLAAHTFGVVPYSGEGHSNALAYLR